MRRAMTGPKVATEPRIDRERQEARGRRDPALLQNDRAVVQRRRRLKDRHEQIVGQRRIERDAAFDVVAQADFALDHQNATDLLADNSVAATTTSSIVSFAAACR